eukprot:15449596-Alexandrium_andersonii.AAC.1
MPTPHTRTPCPRDEQAPPRARHARHVGGPTTRPPTSRRAEHRGQDGKGGLYDYSRTAGSG